MNQRTRSGILFFVVAGPYFLLTWFTTNQVFSFDAITNAIACESNEVVRWFHPNHLLYPAMGVLWYRIEHFFGYLGFSLYSLARLNSLLVSVALGGLFVGLAKHLGKKKSACTVFLLGSCYAVWAYAVDGRAIGTSVFFSIFLILMMSKFNRKPVLSLNQIVGLAGLSVFYILSHAIAVFHVFALVWWLGDKRSSSSHKALRPWVLYPSLVFGTLLSLYLLVFVAFIPSSFGSFISWSLGYAGYDGASQVMGSRYWAFQWGPVFSGLWSGWCNAFFFPHSSAISAFSVAKQVLGALFLIVLILVGGKTVRTKDVFQRLILTWLLWGGGTMLFLAFWSPGQEGFRLHTLVPFIIAGAFAYREREKYFLGSLICGACLFWLNFSGPISHAADIRNNTEFQLTKEIATRVSPGDTVLFAKRGAIQNFEVYLPYFFPHVEGGSLSGRLFAFRETDLRPLKNRFAEKLRKGNRVYLMQDFFDENTQKKIETNHGLPPGTIQAFVDSYEKKRAVFVLSNGYQGVQIQ